MSAHLVLFVLCVLLLALIIGTLFARYLIARSNANSQWTSRGEIVKQLNEPRPLPMGQKEFMEWSDRIISGALIPCDDPESLRGILATMLIQLPSTVSHKEDAYFIHSLRKAAVNEVAHANFRAIKDKKAQEAAEQSKAGPSSA